MHTSSPRAPARVLSIVAFAVCGLLLAGLPAAEAEDGSPSTPSSVSDPSPSSSTGAGNPSDAPGDQKSPDAPSGTDDGQASDALGGLHTDPASRSVGFSGTYQILVAVSGASQTDYRIELSADGVNWAPDLLARRSLAVPGWYKESWKVLSYTYPSGETGDYLVYTPATRPQTINTGAYSHTVYYRVRDPQATTYSNVSPVTATVGSWCSSKPTPGGTWGAAPTLFNYPYSTMANRTAIRRQALAAINATPCGQQILMAMFAVNDGGWDTVKALYAAHLRGVAVRVMANSHQLYGPESSPGYKWLMGRLGQSTSGTLVSGTRPAASFAQVCVRACRGTGGNHHYKMLLISQTGQYRNMVMTGSANMTSKAAFGQWNHMDTVTCTIASGAGCTNADALTAQYRPIFYQLVSRTKGGSFSTTGVTPFTQFYPLAGANSATDIVMKQLNAVQCVYAGGGRTQILIGQYAWFEERGVWLAQKVRALWQAGCNVQIHYAVMGNTVKSILYSTSGRGRIPMRQVATYYRDGTVANYDHSKYMVIKGSINGQYQARVISGTTNYNNMGFYSDDFTTIFPNDLTKANAYAQSFAWVYGGPYSRVPSPASKLPGELNRGALTFGQGKYASLDPA